MLMVVIKADVWLEVYSALQEALENSKELLELHLESHGEETRKNREIANAYRREQKKLTKLIGYAKEDNRGPF